MRPKTQAAAMAAVSAGTLIAGCALAAVFPGACLAWVIAGFAGYVACGRRAIVLWRLDERVFDHPHKHLRARRPPVRMVALVLLLGALASLVFSHSLFWERA